MTAGGIAIPESIADRDKKTCQIAEVVAMGSEAFSDQDKTPVKVGDKIFIRKYAGIDLPRETNDKSLYKLVDHNEIVAVIEDE